MSLDRFDNWDGHAVVDDDYRERIAEMTPHYERWPAGVAPDPSPGEPSTGSKENLTPLPIPG